MATMTRLSVQTSDFWRYLILLLQLVWSSSAFQVTPFTATIGITPPATKQSPSSLFALPPAFLDNSNLILADDSSADIPIEQAFQDSVDFFDLSGPLGTILLATVGVVALLVLLKSLTNQMDAAIEKVLVDYESSLKKISPQRWEEIAAELEKVPAEELPEKLVSIMEKMQEEEPELMSEIKEGMTNRKKHE